MRQLVFFIRNMLSFLALLVSILFLPAPAFAVVGDLTVTGLPPNTSVSLTGDDPKVKLEGKTDDKGVFVFQLGRFNLPAGSDVKVTIAGDPKGGRTIPSLRDGPNTRDIRSPDRIVDDAPDHGFNLSFQIGPEWRGVGKTGIGTDFAAGTSAGDERYLLKFRKRVPGVAPELRIGGEVRDQRFQIGIKGFVGSADDNATEPVSGRNVALTFHRPFAGSNGIALGATGMHGKIDVDSRAVELDFTLQDYIYKFQKGPFTLSIGPRAFAGYDSTDYDGNLQSLTFPVAAKTNQEIKQPYGGLGVGVQKTLQLADGFELYAGVNADLAFYHAKYDGRQHVVCPPCPVAVQNVRIKTSDSDSQFAFRPNVSVGLEYEFSKSSSLGFNVSYQYWSKFPFLVNPPNPLKHRPPSLKDDSVHRNLFGVFYKYAFGN